MTQRCDAGEAGNCSPLISRQALYHWIIALPTFRQHSQLMIHYSTNDILYYTYISAIENKKYYINIWYVLWFFIAKEIWFLWGLLI